MPNLLRVPGLNPTLVPAVPVEVDWTHPLANGLLALYIPGLSFADLAGKCPALSFINPAQNAFGMTQRGPGIVITSPTISGGLISQPTGLPNPDFSRGGTMMSVQYHVINNSGDQLPTEIGIAPVADTGRHWFLYTTDYSPGDNLNLFQNSNYVGAFTNYDIRLPRNRYMSLATTFVPSGNNIGYLNGVALPNILAAQPTLGVNKATDCLVLGRSGNQTAISGAWWTRALSADEIAWLSREPFAMLRPIQPRRTWSVASGPIRTRPRVMLIA